MEIKRERTYKNDTFYTYIFIAIINNKITN